MCARNQHELKGAGTFDVFCHPLFVHHHTADPIVVVENGEELATGSVVSEEKIVCDIDGESSYGSTAC